MDLLAHVLLGLAIYPVSRLYWKKIFYPSINWGPYWVSYITQTVGWLLLPLWWFFGVGSMTDYTDLEYVPIILSQLGNAYLFIWIAGVLGLVIYAWLHAEEAYENEHRKREAEKNMRHPESGLPMFMHEFLESMDRESVGQHARKENTKTEWICICGTHNPLDRSKKIQNCSHCHCNRDFALQHIDKINKNKKKIEDASQSVTNSQTSAESLTEEELKRVARKYADRLKAELKPRLKAKLQEIRNSQTKNE